MGKAPALKLRKTMGLNTAKLGLQSSLSPAAADAAGERQKTETRAESVASSNILSKNAFDSFHRMYCERLSEQTLEKCLQNQSSFLQLMVFPYCDRMPSLWQDDALKTTGGLRRDGSALEVGRMEIGRLFEQGRAQAEVARRLSVNCQIASRR